MSISFFEPTAKGLSPADIAPHLKSFNTLVRIPLEQISAIEKMKNKPSTSVNDARECIKAVAISLHSATSSKVSSPELDNTNENSTGEEVRLGNRL